jgi:hypothetical protein
MEKMMIMTLFNHLPPQENLKKGLQEKRMEKMMIMTLFNHLPPQES